MPFGSMGKKLGFLWPLYSPKIKYSKDACADRESGRGDNLFVLFEKSNEIRRLAQAEILTDTRDAVPTVRQSGI